MENIRKDKTVKFFISVIGLVVIGFTLRELSNIFIPFVIAYFLFFAFSPLNAFFAKYKIPMFIIILVDIAITALAAWGVSAFIIGSFSQFADQLPVYEEKLNSIVRSAAQGLGINDPFYNNFSIKNLYRNIDYKLLAGNIFTSTFSLLGNVFFVLFFFVFVVTGHNNIYEAIKKRFVHRNPEHEYEKLKTISPAFENNETEAEKLERETSEREDKLAGTFKNITEQIQRYIIAKIGVNLGAGVSVFIVCVIFKIDFPIVWALFTFLFNFIPSLGSAIALVLPVVFVLIQTGSAGFTILIAVIIAAIQTLFFNFLEPQIIGRRLNLNPLLILLSVLLWGYVWGIVGMLLSVPLTAIIKIIMSNSESKDMQFLSDLMSKE
jgi:predicted PurR-regulated permease PerM